MITYENIIDYLDAIAQANTDTRGDDVNTAPHKKFWYDPITKKPIPVDAFINGLVLDGAAPMMCGTDSIKIATPDKATCPFYQALIGASGFCNKKKMPLDGPYITDPASMFKLADGTQISGQDIKTNIEQWLDDWKANGKPA